MNRVLFTLILVFTTQTLAQQKLPDSTAILKTNLGEIRIKLRADIAPNTVTHFSDLAKGNKEFRDAISGRTIANTPFYKKLTFHRIHPKLGIFTGCQWGTGHGWPGSTIPFEKQPDSIKFDRPFLAGFSTIPGRPNTGGSQFFITTKPQPESVSYTHLTLPTKA